MPKLKSIIQVLLLALLAPWLYDRYLAFSSLIANRPSKYSKLRTFKSHEILYRDELRNCEDVVMEKSLGLAFLSCDPGRDHWNTVMGTFLSENPRAGKAGIYVFDYSTPDLSPSARLTQLPIDDPDLHPLGIAYDAPTSTLYVVNHARHRGPHILILHVDVQSRSTTLIAHFAHPLLHAPNALLPLGEGRLYVTNDHYVRAAVSPLLSKVESFTGVAGGSVVYVDTRRPRLTRVVARVPFANGIESVNASTVGVASSAKAGVYLFEKEEDWSLGLKRVVRTPAAVDNLSGDGEGSLLMAGHPFAMGLMAVAKGRKGCVEGDEEACGCTAGSWAAEWSEEGGLRELYRDDGREFCSSSTIARDGVRGVGMMSGLYERGVLVFET